MKGLHWYYKFLIVFIVFLSMFIFLTKNMSERINSSSYKNYVNFIGIPLNYIEKHNVFRINDIMDENQKLEQEVLQFSRRS